MTSYPCNKYEQITPSYLLSVKYFILTHPVDDDGMMMGNDDDWRYFEYPLLKAIHHEALGFMCFTVLIFLNILAFDRTVFL